MKIMQFANGLAWPVDGDGRITARATLTTDELVHNDQDAIEDLLSERAVGSLNLWNIEKTIVGASAQAVTFEFSADATDVIAELASNLPEGKTFFMASAFVGSIVGGAKVAEAMVLAFDYDDAAMEAETCVARIFPSIDVRVVVGMELIESDLAVA